MPARRSSRRPLQWEPSIINRYQADLAVVDTHDADGVFNEHVVFDPFHRGSGRICDSEAFPEDGLITLASWVDSKEPASSVVEEAIGWRHGLGD